MQNIFITAAKGYFINLFGKDRERGTELMWMSKRKRDLRTRCR